MKTAAIYARVANSEEPIEHQLLALRMVAAQGGYEVVEYTDIVSGTKARRLGLDALMRDARKRKFSVVIVAAFDRIARSTKHFLQTVDELGSLGIGFMSQQEDICTAGDLGQFLTLTRSLLKLQADLNKELIRAGMRRRKLEGFKLGRKPLPVSHASLVRDRHAGMSLTDTARKYGVSRASVVRFVRLAQRRDMGGGSGLPVGRTQVDDVECVA